MNSPRPRLSSRHGADARGRLRTAALAAIATLLVFALSGCMRFVSTLEVSEGNTVSGEYVIAVVTGTGQSVALTDAELSEELWGDTGLADALQTEKVEPYEQDGYTGIRVVFTNEPLAAFAPTSEHWGITRQGDEFVVSGLVSGGELTGDASTDEVEPTVEPTVETTTEPTVEPTTDTPAGSDEEAPDVRVTLTFPGPVTASNGVISGRTVSWVITDDNTELQARASAVPEPDRARTLAFLVLGVLALAAIAYWLAGVVGRAQRPDIPRGKGPRQQPPPGRARMGP